MAVKEELLQVLRERVDTERPWMSSTELALRLGTTSLATVKRHLDALVRSGDVLRAGQRRGTRYSLNLEAHVDPAAEAPPSVLSAAQALKSQLLQPLASRQPVTYQADFVVDYVPNQSFLLPETLAHALAAEGGMKGQQPAGTYARRVLEPLLIDLSWSSSRLEGNPFSLLATEALFRKGTADGDLDAVMLLNHKAAIEFLIDAVPEYGLTSGVIHNLHALLMQDLLTDSAGLGVIRHKIVSISGTTYYPCHVPTQLREMFELILGKARQINNPVEAAFFLWVNLAYLQPFEDGNKRTSRLAANIPLMLYNCAPLSFLDIEAQDYAYAMMGVYEHRNVALAVELFESVYRRSITKYGVQLAAVGIPDPVRLRLRSALGDVVGMVVRERRSLEQAVAAVQLAQADAVIFRQMLVEELRTLGVHNCARYRLTISQTQHWIDAGRPQ
ncbi:hypothetical protein NS274_11015 [Pseudomonas oryzihabitans]|nr:hypothetical protein NS274_11015 [Pseudomonas psychrotolerans]